MGKNPPEYFCVFFANPQPQEENLKATTDPGKQSNAHHWQSHRINIKHKYDSNNISFYGRP